MAEGSSGRETQQRSSSSSINSFFKAISSQQKLQVKLNCPKKLHLLQILEDFTENSILDFLQPAASSLNYWGSSTNTENKTDPSSLKQGEPATSDC
eukprot:gene12569-13856_t